jgi:hypothetical protein
MSMGIHDWLNWWNLIYVVPLLISVAWILTTVFSGMHGHAGHGASHGAGHHIGEVGHHVAEAAAHAVHHGDVGHTAAHGHVQGDGAHHAHAHTSHEDTAPSRLLMLLGIGQVPVTLLIGVFLLCWGAFGMLTNQLFGIALRYPGIYIWPSLGVTFVSSSAVTRAMASIVGRLLPGDETYGVTRFELVGSMGRSVFPTSEKAGTIDIKDRYGTVHRVQAKVEPGKEAIPSGADCIVVDFDEDDKRFIVREGSV